ncbi:hypothetical protein V1J52_02460 [Streptomyces sp. TRM 70351]|uniref:hypothetical protein n=1 Tax=Streptomyces sp. TRM 70351 TaxID=3116552 RepID=UPI002E7B8B99|nr:hypothetical protein [Streptomyces sp. TRM 70351]MEE1927053.1 hypothetical protein [Streptomyces sp. TRM 70351]
MARFTRNPPLAAAAATAVLALGGAGLTGWNWYAAAHDDALAFARGRDDVAAAGAQAVQNLNTLDHRELTAGYDTWEDSTTGELHEQLTDGRGQFTERVREARTVTTARVLSTAVTELDDRAGRAAVMVALRITVTAPEQEPAVKESRMLGELTRTPQGWKLSGLSQASLGESAGQ